MPFPDVSLSFLTLTSVIVSYLLTLWQAHRAAEKIEELKQNDLLHLDERLTRIEEKLDQHLQYHMLKI